MTPPRGTVRRPAPPREAAAQAPLRAVIYDRVSDDKGGRSRSVEQQNEANARACAQERWTEAARFADPDYSASRFATRVRPGWVQLVAGVEAGRFQVVILWEPSRGSREMDDWVPFLTTCRRMGVLIHVTSHGRTYDPGKARDRKALIEDGMDSEYESEKTSERVRRDKTERLASGLPTGAIAYGYRRVYHPVTRALVRQEAHPAEAAVVGRIVAEAARGVPISKLTEGLRADGVPSPRGAASGWSRQVVRGVAINPTYIGVRPLPGGATVALRNPGEEPAAWPMLAVAADHYAAVRILTDPARKTTRPGRDKWLLSQLAICGGCGAPMQGSAGRGPKPDTYQCSRYVAGRCAAISAHLIEPEMLNELAVRLADPKWFAALTAPGDDAAALAARAEAGELLNQRQGYVALAREYAPADLLAILADFDDGIKAANARAQRAPTPGALRGLLPEDVPTLVQARELLNGLGVAQIKAILRHAGFAVVVHRPAVRGRRATFTEPTWGTSARPVAT